MDVVLRTNTSDPALALRNVERFADGSGFGALLVVRSRAFGAEQPFHVEPGPLVTFLWKRLSAWIAPSRGRRS